MFTISTAVTVSQVSTHVKTDRTAHFERVQITVCQLHLNEAVFPSGRAGG